MSDFPGWASPGEPARDQPAPAPLADGPSASPPGRWGSAQPQSDQAQSAQPQSNQPQSGQPQWGQPQWGQQPAAWGGGPGIAQAAKPGVIPLRPLGVGEILDGAITTIRRYPRATLGLSAVVVTITQVLQFFLVRSFTTSFNDAAATGDLDISGTTGLFLGLGLSFVGGVVLTGALTVIMGQAVLGRPISLEEAWRAVRSRLWALIGCAILVLLFDLLALLFLVVPFFFVWPALSLATPALMLEKQTVWRAIKRSVALVRGQFWRCLGVVLLAWLIKTIVGSTLAIPFSLLGGGLSLFDPTPDPAADLGTGYLILTTIGAIVAGTVVAPFSAGVSALLYVDRRMRAEGLDVALAASAASPPADS